MGAVRNSNTRASHASVEPPSITGPAVATTSQANDSKAATIGAGGVAGPVAGVAALDSPHLGPETPDRRPSFSYLRRASDRRRRRRLMRGEDPDVRQEFKDFVHPRSGKNRRESGESTAGQDSATDNQRRDSGQVDPGIDQLHQQQPQQQQKLRRSDQIYDEEGEDQLYLDDSDQQHAAQQYHHQQHQQDQHQDQQRRQSNSDRLTDAVSDVMEFVRDESFRRGKRRSMIKRRAGPHSHLGGAGQHVGGSSHGLHQELDDPDEFGGGDVQQQQHSGSMGSQERSPSYRRRRIMRRSPRRAVQAARQLNDSDTGSGASLSHEPLSHAGMMGSSRAQRVHRLQQHGGSEQDAGLMYGSHRSRPGPALLIEQHRRYQSADASSTSRQPRGHMMGGYYEDTNDDDDGDGFGLRRHHGLSTTGQTTMPASASGVIKPILVGSSPPPMVGLLEEEFASDSGQERNGDSTTSIRVASNQDDDNNTSTKQQSPVRFIAPKVAPLNSPTSPLLPDEELIPPDVPYRGRRLPQIPGSGIIKSAADFLHSSIYGGQRHHQPGIATGAGAALGAPLTGGYAASSHMGDPTGFIVGAESPSEMSAAVFPLVCESPTSMEPGNDTTRVTATLKRQQTMGSAKPSPLLGDIQMGTGSFEGSSSINFPRVSFSPTHLPPVTSATAGPSGSVRYPPSQQTPASMIATHQATGGATQSTVLGSVASMAASDVGSGGIGVTGGGMMQQAGDRGWTLSRRAHKKEDEDDWF